MKYLGLVGLLCLSSTLFAQVPPEAMKVIKGYDAAILAQDADAYERLLSDDCVIIGWKGQMATKSQLVEDATKGSTKYEYAKSDNNEFRVFGDTILWTGHWKEKGTQEGQPFDRSARFTTVLANRDGKWQVVSDQVTEIASDEATRLMSYFSSFEGTWDIADSMGNKGVLKIAKGASGKCHVLSYVAGESKFNEVCGFDPVSKKWTCYGFSATGERYAYVMHPPARDTVRDGDVILASSSGVDANGRKTSAKMTFTVNSKNEYRLEITERTIGEEDQPDLVVEFERKR